MPDPYADLLPRWAALAPRECEPVALEHYRIADPRLGTVYTVVRALGDGWWDRSDRAAAVLYAVTCACRARGLYLDIEDGLEWPHDDAPSYLVTIHPRGTSDAFAQAKHPDAPDVAALSAYLDHLGKLNRCPDPQASASPSPSPPSSSTGATPGQAPPPTSPPESSLVTAQRRAVLILSDAIRTDPTLRDSWVEDALDVLSAALYDWDASAAVMAAHPPHTN